MTILKKLTTIILLIILFFPSCSKEDFIKSFTEDYTVFQDDWKKGRDDDSGFYFYYEFREQNLTKYVYDHGIMQAFLVLNNQSLSPLPFDDFWEEDGYMWTEQVTCEFRPGYVKFILKYSDHLESAPYYVYDFRVRFMW